LRNAQEKRPIGREICYRILEVSNTLCTRPTGGTKKNKGFIHKHIISHCNRSQRLNMTAEYSNRIYFSASLNCNFCLLRKHEQQLTAVQSVVVRVLALVTCSRSIPVSPPLHYTTVTPLVQWLCSCAALIVAAFRC